MNRTEILKEKCKYSSVLVDPPRGSHEYKGFCVLPDDKRYFTSDTEVDEFEQVVLTEWLARRTEVLGE